MVTKDFAEVMNAAWLSVLKLTRYPNERSLGLDGTTFQFYCDYDYFGETWSPDSGLPAMLVDLGHKLCKIAQADEKNKEPLQKEAYRKHVDMQGRHHNPSFPAGFPTLMKAMIENHARFPHKQLKVKNVLGDGDLAAVHSQIVLGPGQASIAAVHLFRFQGDKIAEMWDIGQSVPADSPNADGAF
jgi:predicted SnoaL-like aldol condensation-catalyzing enzyme